MPSKLMEIIRQLVFHENRLNCGKKNVDGIRLQVLIKISRHTILKDFFFDPKLLFE